MGTRTRFLLDTSVVSELARKRPDPAIVAWLKSPGDLELVLPFAATSELYRGAELIRKEAPERAKALDEWIDTLFATDIEVPALTHDVAKLYGRIAAVPALKDLWAPDPRMKAPKMGLDLLIAAQSIAQSIPSQPSTLRISNEFTSIFHCQGSSIPAEQSGVSNRWTDGSVTQLAPPDPQRQLN